MKIISINDISKINLRFICEIIFEKLKWLMLRTQNKFGGVSLI